MARRTTGLSLAQQGIGRLVEEKPPRLGKRELEVLRPFLSAYKWKFIGAGLLLLIASATKISGPVFLRYAIDRGIGPGRFDVLNLFGSMFVGAALLGYVALRRSTLLMGRSGEQVLRDIRVHAFRHLNSLSLGFFERERSGRLVARITSDIEAVERLATENLVRIITETLFLVGGAVVLFALDYKLALTAMSVLPLMAIATLVFRRASERTYREVRERVSSVLSFIQETLAGVHVVQAFATERERADRFSEVNRGWAEANVQAFRLEAYYFPTVEFLGVIGTIIVLIFGGFRFSQGDLDFGVLAAFTVYLTLFFDPIHHLSELYSQFQSALAGLARVAQLLETAPEITDSPNAADLPPVQGGIEVDDVSFAYGPGAPLALERVGFTVDPGETVALVGPTGAGKSTIVKLLARFYDPTKGSVRLDGLDLRDLSIDSFRNQIALVPQEGILFGGTVRENIRFGRPDATDDEIEEVCREIGIDDFIRSLPEGYETEVRERGSRLAAGEKQLIALARALLARPSLILLDEATSSLDSATEFRVERAFRRALKGKTCVVIAHRLSTVMDAQRIFVIDGGRIVEEGSHDQLLDRGGRYASLYSSWLAGANASTLI